LAARRARKAPQRDSKHNRAARESCKHRSRKLVFVHQRYAAEKSAQSKKNKLTYSGVHVASLGNSGGHLA
jgi:hypothetical protein